LFFIVGCGPPPQGQHLKNLLLSLPAGAGLSAFLNHLREELVFAFFVREGRPKQKISFQILSFEQRLPGSRPYICPAVAFFPILTPIFFHLLNQLSQLLEKVGCSAACLSRQLSQGPALAGIRKPPQTKQT